MMGYVKYNWFHKEQHKPFKEDAFNQANFYYNFPKSLLGATKFINNAKLYVRGVDLLCFDQIGRAHV